MNHSTTTTTRLLRWREVCRLLGVGRTLLYAMVDRGELPRPVQITNRLNGWPEPEIAEWIARRIEKRDAGQQPQIEPPRRRGRPRKMIAPDTAAAA